MLEHFKTQQQILFDLTANYLEPLGSACQRLAYLSSLRDPSSGKFIHGGLTAVYGAESVDKVVACCHEEMFERLLEMPLSAQQQDLRGYLCSLPGSFAENARSCQERAANWVPPQAPSYLKELFHSNLSALLELLQDHKSTAR